MNPDSHPDEPTLLRHTLRWGAATVVAAWVLWKVGDPWLLEHFGSGAPWWAYLLLCMKFAWGILQLLAADAALPRAASDNGLLPSDGGRRPHADPSLGWQGSSFPAPAGAVARDFQATSGSTFSH